MALSKWMMKDAGGLGKGFIDIEIDQPRKLAMLTFLRKRASDQAQN